MFYFFPVFTLAEGWGEGRSYYWLHSSWNKLRVSESLGVYTVNMKEGKQSHVDINSNLQLKHSAERYQSRQLLIILFPIVIGISWFGYDKPIRAIKDAICRYPSIKGCSKWKTCGANDYSHPLYWFHLPGLKSLRFIMSSKSWWSMKLHVH